MQADLQQLNSKVDSVQLDIHKLKYRIRKPKVPRLPSPNAKSKSPTGESSKSLLGLSVPASDFTLSTSSLITPTVSASTLPEVPSPVASPVHLTLKELVSLPHVGKSIDRTTALLELRNDKYKAFQICPVPPNRLSSALLKYQKRVKRLRQRIR